MLPKLVQRVGDRANQADVVCRRFSTRHVSRLEYHHSIVGVNSSPSLDVPGEVDGEVVELCDGYVKTR